MHVPLPYRLRIQNITHYVYGIFTLAPDSGSVPKLTRYEIKMDPADRVSGGVGMAHLFTERHPGIEDFVGCHRVWALDHRNVFL